jgi:hypothetical protein
VNVALAGCSSTLTVESTPGQQRPSDDEVAKRYTTYPGRHGKYLFLIDSLEKGVTGSHNPGDGSRDLIDTPIFQDSGLPTTLHLDISTLHLHISTISR